MNGHCAEYMTGTANGTATPLAGRRVALFSGNYNYIRDGANLALNRLVRHLEEAGAQVRVYSPTTATPAFEPAGTLVSVPSVPFPGRGDYFVALGLPWRIRQDIRRFDPHLVHLSAPDILGTRALSWSKAELGVPVIASLHTRFETYFDYYQLNFVTRWIERHLARFYARCDYVLVPTTPMLEEMSHGGADRRIRLWGRGVDRSLFNPERRSEDWRGRMGFGKDDVVVLFFGRLVLEKGVDPYAEIVSHLLKSHPSVRPLVVGDGPARSKLEDTLPGARFTGQIQGEELATAIASADIMINPSLSEAFGNVTLEAMASGLAVVAADCGSTRNLITHRHDGWLCDTQDCEATARAMAPLVESAEKRKRMGQAAARAAARHTWPAVLDDVVEIYAEALGMARSVDPAQSMLISPLPVSPLTCNDAAAAKRQA